MNAQISAMYQRPSDYSRVNSSEKSFNAPARSQELRPSASPKLASGIPYLAVESRDTPVESYTRASNGCLSLPSSSEDIKKAVKWTHVALLVLRICAWLGAAGLIACLVMVKPIGTFMDWIIRLTPVAALFHLTYSIYHLSRSSNSRKRGFASGWLIFVATIDLCLIPLQVIIAILARAQLFGFPDSEILTWRTILEDDSQRHIVIFSTFVLALADAGLHLISLVICIVLAFKLWSTTESLLETNQSEANLTTRNHQKASLSVSTFMTGSSNRDSKSSLIEHSKVTGPTFRVLDLPKEHNRGEQGHQVQGCHRANRSLYPPNSLWRHGMKSEHPAMTTRNMPPRFIESKPSVPVEGVENRGAHPLTPSDSPPRGPPELQCLRSQNHLPKKPIPAPLSVNAKYDFSNRSPRPLGLHPPTPRGSTPASNSAFDVRVLRNIDGNSSAPRISASMRQSVNLDVLSIGILPEQDDHDQIEDDIVSVGNVARSKARVVSSGSEQQILNSEVKLRKVSGKAAEEGRAGIGYMDF